MKKAAFTIMFLVSFVALQAQLNPINNLEFEQSIGYGCPYSNCFTLSWESPDTSIQDTLIGYNIYRNNILYLFQEYPGISCIEGQGDDCPYYNFTDLWAFWIKVTAVYNSSLTESVNNDSIYYFGPYTNIDLKKKKNFKIANNPIIKGNNIYIELLNNFDSLVEISVIDYQGQRIENLPITRESNFIEISTDKLNTGIYIIVLSYEGTIVSKKTMII